MAPKTSNTMAPYPIKQPIKTEKPAPLKTSKRTPGASHYAQSGCRGGWYFTAWHYRRSLKVRGTSAAQDVARCYEAMTPKMYAHNLVIMEEQRPDLYRWGKRYILPTDYESLLFPKHTPKKQARGSANVGRKKTSVTRMFKRENPMIAIRPKVQANEHSLDERLSDRRVAQTSESKAAEANNQNELQSSVSISTDLIQSPGKVSKHVRFDEDSEWLDIDGESVSDSLEGEMDEAIFVIDDEYILL